MRCERGLTTPCVYWPIDESTSIISGALRRGARCRRRREMGVDAAALTESIRRSRPRRGQNRSPGYWQARCRSTADAHPVRCLPCAGENVNSSLVPADVRPVPHLRFCCALNSLAYGTPKDWKRPAIADQGGRQWLRTVESDLQPTNIGLFTVCRRAQDRCTWTQLVKTAALQSAAHMMMISLSRYFIAPIKSKASKHDFRWYVVMIFLKVDI